MGFIGLTSTQEWSVANGGEWFNLSGCSRDLAATLFYEGTSFLFGLGPDTPPATEAGDEFGVSNGTFAEIRFSHAALIEKPLDVMQEMRSFVCHDRQFIRFRGYYKRILSRTCELLRFGGYYWHGKHVLERPLGRSDSGQRHEQKSRIASSKCWRGLRSLDPQ